MGQIAVGEEQAAILKINQSVNLRKRSVRVEIRFLKVTEGSP
jgi:hypothetical protein